MTKTPATKKEPTSPSPDAILNVVGAEIAADALEWFAAFEPVDRVPLSQYMAEEGRLEDGTRLRPYPFQRDIADAFTDYETEQVTVRKGSRVGYSTIVQSFIGYRISKDPARTLIYQPTIDDAENYSKDDVEPVLQWPSVRKVAQFKPRHRDNQIRAKRYKGGWVQIKGANSPKEFRRVSADDVILEEPDGYPPSARDEGDPARLAMRRNASSPRRFTAAGSTPKIKGASRIDALFDLGTQEFRYVPCPQCGTMQILVFGDGTGPGIKWEPRHNPTRAWYRCVSGCDIEETSKAWMDEQGEFRAHNPAAGPRHRSFHIWAAYSQQPGAAWLVIAREFLEVRKDPNLLKTFINQFLGEAWQETGEAPEWQRLYERRDAKLKLGTVPDWAGMIVGAADLQRADGGRIELDIWAFGPGRRRALVDHIEVTGSIADKATWAKLDTHVDREWRTADGRRMRLARVGVDTGDGENTMYAYAWARRRLGFVMALKGRATLAAAQAISGPTRVDATIEGRKIKKGVKLWLVGTSMLKLQLYGYLQLDKPVDGEKYPEGYVFLPDGTTDEWIKQLCAEQLVMVKRRNGRTHREWQQTRPRNEALDNAVYAHAVAIALGVDRWTDADWRRIRGETPKPRRKAAPADKPNADAPPPPKQAGVKPKRPNPFTSRGR